MFCDQWSIVIAAVAAALVIGIVAVMTGEAGGGAQVLGVTVAAGGPTVIDAAPAFIGDAGVAARVAGEPIVRGVARGTI